MDLFDFTWINIFFVILTIFALMYVIFQLFYFRALSNIEPKPDYPYSPSILMYLNLIFIIIFLVIGGNFLYRSFGLHLKEIYKRRVFF